MSEQMTAEVIPARAMTQNERNLAFIAGSDSALQFSYTLPAPEKGSPAYGDYAARVTQLMSKADGKLSDTINETILLRDVFAHIVTLRPRLDKESGELTGPQELVRTVLIDADGYTYEAVSQGALDGLRAIFQLFGHPSSWSAPVPVSLRQVELEGGKRVFNLVAVGADGSGKKKGKK